MKTLFQSISALTLLSLLLISCKKEYTCECFNPGGVFETHSIKDTKKNAEEKCSEYAVKFQTMPFSETSCQLK
ncbi:hypothetical protein [Brumimicrobium oceani]|uniref:Lipoprotein n=1 Tax=Brumimicrobium oceani TaxID=2100725 RepID=A0A2U2XFL9_9FLAO|nr:hypothetical protein [Brumimicrobium oceani]PWH86599.1 hypothetical protein DIT68_05025 [Brumimicrobium oceani]